RLVRVSESIRGVLARLVSRERTLEGMLLTITGVEVSPDLRHATVFISHLDGRTPDGDKEVSLVKTDHRPHQVLGPNETVRRRSDR
ncbi:MAG: ribosome-binding factor A, partial [Actinobacteria bacterium]|nr:ribosome-binding factor A [Actinomycetota bacterium]